MLAGESWIVGDDFEIYVKRDTSFTAKEKNKIGSLLDDGLGWSEIRSWLRKKLG